MVVYFIIFKNRAICFSFFDIVHLKKKKMLPVVPRAKDCLTHAHICEVAHLNGTHHFIEHRLSKLTEMSVGFPTFALNHSFQP